MQNQKVPLFNFFISLQSIDGNHSTISTQPSQPVYNVFKLITLRMTVATFKLDVTEVSFTNFAVQGLHLKLSFTETEVYLNFSSQLLYAPVHHLLDPSFLVVSAETKTATMYTVHLLPWLASHPVYPIQAAGNELCDFLVTDFKKSSQKEVMSGCVHTCINCHMAFNILFYLSFLFTESSKIRWPWFNNGTVTPRLNQLCSQKHESPAKARPHKCDRKTTECDRQTTVSQTTQVW